MEATPPSQGLSILDLHQHSGLVSGDTSDSEGGSAYSHGTFPAALRASAPGTPRSGLGLTYAPARQPQQLVPPPAGFVPVPVAEPQSPMACGLHWADGLPAQQQQPAGSGPARLGSLEATADTLGNCGPLSSAFRPLSAMDLEQVRSGGGAARRPPPRAGRRRQPGGERLAGTRAHRRPATLPTAQDPAPLWGVSNPAELGVQPWYFGASMDLACLAPGSGLPAGAAMDCCCSTAAASLDDDDIPLLTLDLGGAPPPAGRQATPPLLGCTCRAGRGMACVYPPAAQDKTRRCRRLQSACRRHRRLHLRPRPTPRPAALRIACTHTRHHHHPRLKLHCVPHPLSRADARPLI